MYYFLAILPVILVLISLIVYLVSYYNDIYSFLPKSAECFSKFKGSPISSIHFKEYLKSVHPYIQKIKCPNMKHNFILDYSKNIRQLPNKYKEMLTTYTGIADKLTKNLGRFNSYPWNFYVSINNLEMNMPYTLDSSIIIALSNLEEIYHTFKHGHINKQFLNMLIHEKIHIVQRGNQDMFNKFYKQIYPMLNERFYNKIPDKIQQSRMNNPDSNNQLWTYTIDNKIMLPLLVYSNNSVNEIAYNIENYNDIIYLRQKKHKLGFKSHTSIYHPNEIFACSVAHHIVDRTLPGNYINFMKKV